MGKLYITLDIFSVVLYSKGEILMDKNKLGKAKKSVNELDANKFSSGVSNTQMSIMYNLSNRTTDINDVALEEKEKLDDKKVESKRTVSVLNDDMASMYNMLRNK